jgi:hypothetical protein
MSNSTRLPLVVRRLLHSLTVSGQIENRFEPCTEWSRFWPYTSEHLPEHRDLFLKVFELARLALVDAVTYQRDDELDRQGKHLAARKVCARVDRLSTTRLTLHVCVRVGTQDIHTTR